MIALLLVAAIVLQVTPSLPGPGAITYGSISYSGPGDVISGVTAWWGLRAYSAAKAGTAAANICNASDATCADVSTLPSGSFDVSTAKGAPLNCGGVGGTCTVKKLYNQGSVAGSCAAGACDLAQATIASRPVLTFNCIGALPCMTWTATQVLASTAVVNTSQPFSVSAVGRRTGGFTSTSDLTSANPTGAVQLGFSSSANTALMYAGTVATATATDNVTHSIQGMFSGASSKLCVDGSTTTVSAFTNAISLPYQMGKGNNGLVGFSVEAGWWPSDISASFASLSSNQHTYWGF